MDHDKFETLSEAVNAYTKAGFTDSFRTAENSIKSSYSKNDYQAKDLKIIKSFRFDGMTNPADESEVFAIEANDGTKGTLVMTHSSSHNHDVEFIRDIPRKK
jgi:hypothetical protein